MTEDLDTRVARWRRDRDARVAATATPEEAAAAIAWLRGRFATDIKWAPDVRTRAAVGGLAQILDMHPVAATTDYERDVYECRAKCTGESWECEDANQEVVVEAPCLHVRLLAVGYADLDDFPAALRLPVES